MGLEFIARVIRTSVVVSLIQLPFVALYFDYRYSLGIVLGCLWGVVNLYFLRSVIVCYTKLSQRSKRQLLLLLLLKFPLLYLVGYLLLEWSLFPVMSLVVGFTLIFAVIVLKALGRLLLSLEGFKMEGSIFDSKGSGGAG
ncbi:MAG: hypothetical protein AMJ41_04250 [candidate division Zixibacteria bacterium DG_27]|nr:MAG: hypothetical protein AMJ41_04250 [candidate division Zixibacteria bacterium DG_27]